MAKAVSRSRAGKLLGIGSLSLAIFAQPLRAQTAPSPRPTQTFVPPTPLEAGKPIETEQTAGAIKYYVFHLLRAQLVEISIDQKGLSVKQTLLGPDEKPLINVYSLAGNYGAETLYAIAASDGNYQLEVTANETATVTPKGTYEVRLAAVRQPGPFDETRIKAQRVDEDADKQMTTYAPEAYSKAAAKWQQAAALWQSANEPFHAANSIFAAGGALQTNLDDAGALKLFNEALSIYQTLGDNDHQGLANYALAMAFDRLKDNTRALDSYRNAVRFFAAAQDVSYQAVTLDYVGRLYDRLGDKQNAIDCYTQARAIFASYRNASGQANALSGRAQVRNQMHETQAALDDYNEAFKLYQSSQDPDDAAAILEDIAGVYDAAQDWQQTQNYYGQALTLEQRLGDPVEIAETINLIGTVYQEHRDYQKALANFQQALAIFQKEKDRRGQGLALNNLGRVHDLMGKPQEAISEYKESIKIDEEISERDVEGIALSNMGLAYLGLGDNARALNAFNQALPLLEAASDQIQIAIAEDNLGDLYNSTGEKQKALDLFAKALTEFEKEGNRGMQAAALSNIGRAYDSMGQEDKALDYFGRALWFFQAVNDPGGEATVLSNIGLVYDALNEEEKALDKLNQALPLFEAAKDQTGKATVLGNIGLVYAHQDKGAEALQQYEKSLRAFQAVQDREGQGTELVNIGESYFAMKNPQKAMENFNRALPMLESASDADGKASVLLNRGEVEVALKRDRKALDDYAQALPLFRSAQDPIGEAAGFLELMKYWEAKRPALAIFFGKQGIDRLQQVRRNISSLPKEDQKSFTDMTADDYRDLADLLVQEERLTEAQQVLDQLKIEEYFEYTQHRGSPEVPGSDITQTKDERVKGQQENQIEDGLTAVGAKLAELDRKKQRAPADEAQYKELTKQLDSQTKRFENFLNTLFEDYGKGDEANHTVSTIDETSSSIQDLLKAEAAGTVAIYTLVRATKIILIVITPTTKVWREVTIDEKSLAGKVNDFVGAMTHNQPVEDVLPKSVELYNLIFAPIEGDLNGAHATTLLWSLDGTLRYLPMAALYDGKQYLAERFVNDELTTAGLGHLSERPHVASWTGVAMGVSKDYEGLGELKSVPAELDAVVTSANVKGSHGPIPGAIMLNDAFTEESMESALRESPALVHIATHFVFNPGDDEHSYLLLGGEETGGKGYELSLADIRQKSQISFHNVELLTLSGCDTAVGSKVGNGKELESLGMVGQMKGAKAVLATLWPIADASVAPLMETFYKLWTTTPGLTKAEALRQAQLSLLHGSNGSARYANPYFWAPFILMGNWK